ncbi:hypothetical protein TSAR_001660 [Trichomalopsis sarcophagae]|uniref:CCHC-type domain-containing protein n=1 Tax=Trichomalopsis sarcophagae TaxID=543379 RepID=A0A232ENG7_9HYME|nr:hypothetical protein TSAR_001660 [Trichomalopsis sarcophagae]
MFGIFHRVFYHIPAVLRCYKCQKFGHDPNFCKNELRCVNCGGNDHLEKELQCPNRTKCANCCDPHKASDHLCLWFEFHKEVNSIMTIQKISKQKATFLVRKKFSDKIQESLNNSQVKVILDKNNPFLDKRELFRDAIFGRTQIEFLNSTEMEATESSRWSDMNEATYIPPPSHTTSLDDICHDTQRSQFDIPDSEDNGLNKKNSHSRKTSSSNPPLEKSSLTPTNKSNPS